MKALSLFSSAGIGELGLKAAGIDVIAANELLADRCALYRENHPGTRLFEGDIWDLREDIISWLVSELAGEELFLAYATPPCQGMSTNGYGKLQAEIAAGRRCAVDERNRLIIPAMEIISALKPRWVLLENVPGMRNTAVSTDSGNVNIIDFVAEQLGPSYVGKAEVVSCSDFGIPQMRRRLITVFTRDSEGKDYFIANRGGFFADEDKSTAPSLREAISHLPPLDAKEGLSESHDFHPQHYVSCMSQEKYWWVVHTPEGETAFNNQCVNPKCKFQGNQRHVDLIENGKWVASKDTPIYCEKCNSLLPRPSMVDKESGQRRLIKGFHSAYRRMRYDDIATALTRNFPFEASDNKIHPTQNRVLSVYEALIIQTIADYAYEWKVGGRVVPRSLIAQAIGESVPPKLIEQITRKIIAIFKGEVAEQGQLDLFCATQK